MAEAPAFVSNGLNLRFARASRSERWRLAGWLGGVSPPNVRLAQVLCYQRDSRVCRFGSEDAAGPAGEDASAPVRA